MINNENKLTDEIRINKDSVHLYSSKYVSKENSSKKDCSIPIITKKSMRMVNFKQKFQQGFKLQNSILPDKCKYVEMAGNKKLYIIEEQPAIRTIKTKTGIDMELEYLKQQNKFEQYDLDSYFNLEKTRWVDFKDVQSFTISLPYVIFIVILGADNIPLQTSVYFRLAPLSGMGDYLLLTPFNNIDLDSVICLGDHSRKQSVNENGSIQNIIDSFWHAIFNNDIISSLQRYQNAKINGVSSIVEWEVSTQKEPNFIFGVEWLKSKHNIYSILQKIKKNWGINSTHLFHQLYEVIQSPTLTKKTIQYKVSGSVINKPLYYDITNGLMPNEPSEVDLHVGDPFYIKNKKAFCYISSFLGDMNTYEVKFIKAERNDGKFLKFKFTKAFRKFIMEQAKQIRRVNEGCTKNGIVIKNKDIVIIDGSVYKQVDYIRRTPYNTIEVKFINGEFYNIENLEVEVLNTDKAVKFKGIDIVKGIKYLVTLQPQENNLTLYASTMMKFKEFSLSTNFNKIRVKMEYKDNSNYKQSYNLNEKRNNIYTKKDNIIVKGCEYIRNGNLLKRITALNDKKQVEFIKTPNSITFDNCKYDFGILNYNTMEKSIIRNGQLFIPSFDLDIQFSIGDTVVVANWDEPHKMFEHYEIIDFKINSAQESLSFKLLSNNSYIEVVEYIKGSIINVGKIRHVSKKFENLKFGDKIRSNDAGIANFPKKDVNTIIGFLTDTGRMPLVLCSNYCTLWYQDVIEKFEVINSEDQIWGSLQSTPGDITKIRLQPGDLVLYQSDSIYLIANDSSTSGYNKPFPLNHLRFNTARNEEHNLKFINFLEPRKLYKDITACDYSYNIVPNFHGSYTKTNLEFKYKLFENERSLINV